MILAFPYHDPEGKYNLVLQRQLGTLGAFFNAICIGATPKTIEGNARFVSELKEQGCLVYENGPNSARRTVIKKSSSVFR